MYEKDNKLFSYIGGVLLFLLILLIRSISYKNLLIIISSIFVLSIVVYFYYRRVSKYKTTSPKLYLQSESDNQPRILKLKNINYKNINSYYNKLCLDENDLCLIGVEKKRSFIEVIINKESKEELIRYKMGREVGEINVKHYHEEFNPAQMLYDFSKMDIKTFEYQYDINKM